MRQVAGAPPVDAEYAVTALQPAISFRDRVRENPVHGDFLDFAVEASCEGDADAAVRVLLVKEHDDDVVGAASFLQTRLFHELSEFLLRDEAGAAGQGTDASELFSAISEMNYDVLIYLRMYVMIYHQKIKSFYGKRW